MHEIAMRHVQFDDLIAKPHGPFCCLNKGCDRAFDARIIQSFGRMPIGAEGQVRCANGRPRILLAVQRTATLPRALRRGFTTGMGQLKAKQRTGQGHRAGCGQDTRHCPLIGV